MKFSDDISIEKKPQRKQGLVHTNAFHPCSAECNIFQRPNDNDVYPFFSEQDIVDSDFDDDVEGDDNENDCATTEGGKSDTPVGGARQSVAEAELRAEERRAARRDRPPRYVDPALKRRTSTPQPTAKAANTPRTLDPPTTTTAHSAATATTTAVAVATAAAPSRPALRKSTKAASARAAEERARKLEGERERRRLKQKREAGRVPVRAPTQAERLVAAKATEEANRASLAELLRLEEEKKRVTVGKQAHVDSDVVSWRSRAGAWTVSMSEGVDVGAVMFPQESCGSGDRDDATT